jgi:hypothetical protein
VPSHAGRWLTAGSARSAGPEAAIPFDPAPSRRPRPRCRPRESGDLYAASQSLLGGTRLSKGTAPSRPAGAALRAVRCAKRRLLSRGGGGEALAFENCESLRAGGWRQAVRDRRSSRLPFLSTRRHHGCHDPRCRPRESGDFCMLTPCLVGGPRLSKGTAPSRPAGAALRAVRCAKRRLHFARRRGRGASLGEGPASQQALRRCIKVARFTRAATRSMPA